MEITMKPIIQCPNSTYMDCAKTCTNDKSNEVKLLVQETPELIKDECKFVWTKSAICLLIEEYKVRKEKFKDPKIKKRILWGQIKQRFQENNFLVNEDTLDKKFRNLKQTYIKIANNKKSPTGGGRVLWEYYDAFLEIFYDDTPVQLTTTLQSMKVIGKSNKLNPKVQNITAMGMVISKTEEAQRSIGSASKDRHSDIDNDNLNVSQTIEPKPKKRKLINNRSNPFREEQLKIYKEKLSLLRSLKESIDTSNIIQAETNTTLKELIATSNTIEVERNKILNDIAQAMKGFNCTEST